ncbi:MAG: transporter substrate-binding domain-containing protein [Thalassotalea sp.]|nr:transporter substrate-binding domain-containing protein [Thalassotalea sp.]
MKLALEKEEIDFDIISPSWLSEEEQSKVIFSKPFLKVTEYIVTLAQLNSPTTVDSTFLPKREVKSYQSKVVGAVRGYYYHDDDTFMRMDFSSERELLLALASGRVKMAIIGEKTAKDWASKLRIAIDFPILHSSGELHLRLNKKHQLILNILNEAIDALSEKGLIEQLSKKYEGDWQGAY